MTDQQEWTAVMLEREREVIAALNRCAAAGADAEAIKTLARECGIDVRRVQIEGAKHEPV